MRGRKGFLMISQVPSSCQLLSLAGLNNAQTFRRCFEMRVQTELSDGEKMFGCFPQMKLVWFWKCKMTPKIHIHTQIWNNFTASVCQWLVPCKFPCGRIHTHMSGLIFLNWLAPYLEVPVCQAATNARLETFTAPACLVCPALIFGLLSSSVSNSSYFRRAAE